MQFISEAIREDMNKLEYKKDYVKDMAMLYHKYVVNNSTVSKLIRDKKGISETYRLIVYLQNTIENMNLTSEKTIKRRANELNKKIRENVELLEDLNLIRKDKKRMERELRDKSKKVKQLENERT